MPSRTKKALEMMAQDPDRSVYSIARELGISPSTVYHALSRRKGKEICECCGQVIPDYDGGESKSTID